MTHSHSLLLNGKSQLQLAQVLQRSPSLGLHARVGFKDAGVNDPSMKPSQVRKVVASAVHDDDGFRPNVFPEQFPRHVSTENTCAASQSIVHGGPCDARVASIPVLHGHGRLDESVEEDGAGEEVDGSQADQFRLSSGRIAHLAI